ncbi:hypothetical protein [Flavobacterium selenitireducens]|uniref:hypothetical protein n=1 Tax=Flavobacterium selenitireducens TaxID=2722704 RepID=UPI00168B55F0|nr:hypothetical protein [Flavobacterium selenitireducens]MBD3581555.1 hypothetical protein [Flavobacterium selenitireducens]
MKMKYTLMLLLIVVSSIAQEKRNELKVELIVDKENNYFTTVAESPYFVKEKVLQIYPGEDLNIEVEINEGNISTMKVVDAVKFPERTISVRFFQESKDRQNAQMMLVVKNPFSKKLFYDAIIYLPVMEKWTRTSIIPILPKLVGYEMWPDVIATIALENWRFIN